MGLALRGLAAGLLTALTLVGGVAAAEEAPKRGGVLTYMIPADAPPSFDGHREATFATVHAVAPFYSVLIRANPENPASTAEFVCDVCTEIPEPTDGGRTYSFMIRNDIKFSDGSRLTAADVAASWNRIVDPPDGIISARRGYYSMIDKIEAPDPNTVVFHLKFATAAFLPAIADPYAFLYKKAMLDQDPRWFEKNILGSGPFRFKEYEAGQSISGVRNPDYYRKGLPYLDGFTGIFDWNCANLITPNHQRKPFDDPRVRRALSLAIDRWNSAPALSRVSVMRTVGGIVFPNSPMAATKEELHQLAGYWPDIEKSRAEARRLLKEAGQENLSFELLNRNVDQPYKFQANWVIDDWSKIGVKVTQRVLPTGPYTEAIRQGEFDAFIDGECQNIVNPLLDGTKYLPHSVSPANNGFYEDPSEVELYDRMLRETDAAKQRAMMRQFEKHVLDDAAHEIFLLWRYRIVPYRAYLKGWKIGPSHYVNQDLATIWLDK